MSVFLKVASLYKVLIAFPSRERTVLRRALDGQDFSSAQEILNTLQRIEESKRVVAENALSEFVPALVLNRVSSDSTDSELYVRRLLRIFLGRDIQLLGKIPHDEAVEQSIRNFIPVVDAAPRSPVAQAFAQLLGNLHRMMEM